MVQFTKRLPVVYKIFTFSRKKNQAYSFSENACIDSRNISSEGIFFASKLGEIKFRERVNLAVCHSIYCTVSRALATVSGMHL
jgi:hypothetical protein